MNQRIIKNIIVAVLGLALVGFTAYVLFVPKNASEPVDPTAALLTLKIVNPNLEQWETDQYTSEFADIKAILEANPNGLDGWLKLGQIKKYVGDYAGAEAVWIHAGELRPKNSTSFHNLADLYVNFIKDYAKAEAAYRVAIANSLGEEKNPYFYRNFYSLYKDYLKDDQKAEATLLQGITDNPTSSDLQLLLGIFYKEKGSIDQAIEHYEQGIALSLVDNLAAEQELAELKRQR